MPPSRHPFLPAAVALTIALHVSTSLGGSPPSTTSSSGAACTTATDCSLNGDCVNSNCVCDPWWAGSPQCDVLVLLPANKSEGYHNASGVSSWGGMSIRDDSVSPPAWHLFASEMVNHCGLGSWKTNSRIVHGVGTAPGGPFSIVQEVRAPFAHNVKVYREPPVSGSGFLLFSIGLWPETPQKCSAAGLAGNSGPLFPAPVGGYPGPTNDTCGPDPLNGGCGLALSYAPTLEGPWTTSGIVVQDQNASALLDCAHTNPSVWFFPNGSAVMAINAGWCHGNLETIGLLQAPSWKGPWTYRVTTPIFTNSDGSPHQCEDPFLWVDARGWHIMVHNQAGGGVARYAHSEDGYSWTLHMDGGGPYNDTIVWDDGTTDSFDVERPQFVFDPDTGKPLYLTNGALGPTSFTLFRPLKQA